MSQLHRRFRKRAWFGFWRVLGLIFAITLGGVTAYFLFFSTAFNGQNLFRIINDWANRQFVNPPK
jgi:hypothetical protein